MYCCNFVFPQGVLSHVLGLIFLLKVEIEITSPELCFNPIQLFSFFFFFFVCVENITFWSRICIQSLTYQLRVENTFRPVWVTKTSISTFLELNWRKSALKLNHVLAMLAIGNFKPVQYFKQKSEIRGWNICHE